ncbi:LLM class flavin-dependent oxidoreductase [Sphingobium amiense]|uniref:LLM class flavin-dependent oxidoreductase n=1 Tax=Sphingobium amiense TaxID=135719 RepID=A0A494WC96_9SPHN|nr:LLM class flavin-dependent oxidoreductase [Sphingobium amiense]BBD98410.1 LLM class flavin-dependent oxidoreductase [Sphingobium amiense]
MEFGVLFTSQPDINKDAYPYHDIHRQVTEMVVAVDRLGYDMAWIAEHHFSNMYGIMPDIFAYTAYLAAKTKNIKLGAAVVTLPMAHPVRVAENAAFLDVLTNGRFLLGFGSGYRPYEFAGFGVPFDERRDIQEEALPLIYDLLTKKKVTHKGKYFNVDISGDYEIFPQAIQSPHPPLYLAAATERSIHKAADRGLGVMFSGLSSTEQLAAEGDMYRKAMEKTPDALRSNPAFGEIDIARWVYVAETDEKARKITEEGILKHMNMYDGKQTVGYLGTVSPDLYASRGGDWYADLVSKNVLIHGSPSTVAAKVAELQEKVGMTSLLSMYPPYYGSERLLDSFTLFQEEVAPQFKKQKTLKVA